MFPSPVSLALCDLAIDLNRYYSFQPKDILGFLHVAKAGLNPLCIASI